MVNNKFRLYRFNIGVNSAVSSTKKLYQYVCHRPYIFSTLRSQLSFLALPIARSLRLRAANRSVYTMASNIAENKISIASDFNWRYTL